MPGFGHSLKTIEAILQNVDLDEALSSYPKLYV